MGTQGSHWNAQSIVFAQPTHHSSGWRPHPLGWGGKPAPIVKIQTRKNFKILSFCACGDSFPIQTVDRKQTFGVNT